MFYLRSPLPPSAAAGLLLRSILPGRRRAHGAGRGRDGGEGARQSARPPTPISPPTPPHPRLPPPAQAAAAASMHPAAPPAGGLTVHRVPCLADNYAWLLVDAATGTTAVVDPAEAGPVEAAVEAQ